MWLPVQREPMLVPRRSICRSQLASRLSSKRWVSMPPHTKTVESRSIDAIDISAVTLTPADEATASPSMETIRHS